MPPDMHMRMDDKEPDYGVRRPLLALSLLSAAALFSLSL
jgi:hypothetical protein